MSEDRKQDGKHFSKEGMATIGLIIGVPCFYVFGLPLVAKLLLTCGMSEDEAYKIFMVIYRPIITYLDSDTPGSAWLENYYEWCAKAIGLS